MPLPLFKLGAILAKQISKPMSKMFKEKAIQNEFFRNNVVIRIANWYHKFDINVRMRVLGLGSPDKVPPMTEKAAIDLGGDILAEFFVFGTATSLILFEYFRQSSNSKSKTDAFEIKVLEMEDQLEIYKKNSEENNKRIAEMSKFLQEQKKKMEEMNKELVKLDKRKNMKFATQATQTTNGTQIGKIIKPKNSSQSVNQDVKNSIVYQCAEDSANKLFK
ncbi:hypothetical protein BpHYR1_042060 [Brachionus plicatilis]|uniref:OPA3-like protein n=1 Tax=Brachionus plicatilis TaxID=10195 RepID=A0A3M7SIM7_BRAPC|nr:hypothetical protein BpHYR1_042060 [Brachionus plicatilis]